MKSVRIFIVILALAGAGLLFLIFWNTDEFGNNAAKATKIEGPESSSERHATRGIVRASGESDEVLFIEHETIPGVMPSMTMPFVLGDREAWGKFSPGDAVALEFLMDERGAVAFDLRRIEAGDVDLPNKSTPASAGANVPRLKVGDTWPDFSLINERGEALGRKQLQGNHVIVTFIFVRCPVPNFCPLLTQKFTSLQKSILAEPGLAESTRLLSISFDPEDTPPVLHEYARQQGARSGFWHFATGDPEKIDELTRRFAVRVEKNGATIDHTLCTALISPEGEVLEIWRGNEWEPSEVMERLRAEHS